MKRSPSSSASGYLWGLGAIAIWSGWWTVTRLGVASELHATDLAALRFGLAGLLLMPLFWRNREMIRIMRPHHLFFIAVGAGAPYAYVTGTGVALTAAGVGGAMTVGLMPAFTLLLSALLLRERVSRNLIAGTVIIVLGALAVVAGHAGDGFGLGLFVLGAAMWAGYTVALRAAGLPPLVAASVVCVASLVFYVPVWLIVSGPAHLLASSAGELLLQAFYQSILSGIAALYCYGKAIERLGAARTSVLAAAVPLCSVIIAALLLHEVPNAPEALGALLLSLGAAIAVKPKRQHPNTSPRLISAQPRFAQPHAGE